MAVFGFSPVFRCASYGTGLLPPSAAEKAELDRRLDEDDASPDNTISWESIKTEAAKRWQR